MDPNKVLTWGNAKNLISVAVVLVILVILAQYFDIAEVRGYIEEVGVWAPLLFVLAKSSTIIFAPLGGSPLYPLAGALFGFWKGALLLIAGDALGGAVSFFLARIFGRKLVLKMLEGQEGLLPDALELMGTVRGYTLARISFIGFPELACWGAGLTKIKFFPFISIYTAVGSISAIFLSGLGALFVEENIAIVPLILVVSLTVSFIPIWIFFTLLRKDRGVK